jgi:hypothetical protein
MIWRFDVAKSRGFPHDNQKRQSFLGSRTFVHAISLVSNGAIAFLRVIFSRV